MNRHILTGLLFAAGLSFSACETMQSNALDKSALSQELRKETMSDVPLPSGCPTLTTSLPAGQTSVTVSYREPATDQTGAPLADLAYTTIYLSGRQTKTKAFRIWTNDAHGGALVTIRDIPVVDQEFGLCVTATNWARKESPPGTAAHVDVGKERGKGDK